MCEHCSLGDELPGLDRRGFIVASGAGLASVLFRPEVASAARRFELICKGAWGARAPTGDFRDHEIVRITIHHSAVALRDNRDAPRHLRGHQRYHQSLGWPDIAYHAIVDRHGNVYKGRPFAARGDSATEYDTRGHLLVMCEGNFDSQRVSRAQLSARRRRGVGLRGVRRRATPDPWPPGLRRHDLPWRAPRPAHRRRDDPAAVRGRLRHGDVEKVRLCGAAGRRRVRAIERGTD